MKTYQFWFETDKEFPQYERLGVAKVDVAIADVLKPYRRRSHDHPVHSCLPNNKYGYSSWYSSWLHGILDWPAAHLPSTSKAKTAAIFVPKVMASKSTT